MKNFISILISVLFILSLIGCGAPVVESNTSDSADKLIFSTVDIDGNSVTEEIIKNSKLVMVNFWEPWCGPCVGEMPDLAQLYDEYKEKGLLIIGVFTSTDMDDEARAILKDCKTTYPVIRSDANLVKFMTNYVPTTIFADSEGNILSEEPVVGSNSYDAWKKMIESYLN